MPMQRGRRVFVMFSFWMALACSQRREEPPAPPPPGPPLPEGLKRVVLADPPPPPVSGGTLRLLSDGTALAADPDRDRIFAVDLTRGERIAEIPLAAGDEPGRSVEDAAGRIHVVLRRGGAVLTLAPGTFAVLGRRAVCPAPRGVAFHAAGGSLFVACAGGELVTLPADPGELATNRTVFLEPDLRDVLVHDGTVLVSRFRAAEVLRIAFDGRIQARVRPQARREIVIDAATGRRKETHRHLEVAWRMVPLPSGDVAMLHQEAAAGERPAATGWGNPGPVPGCGGTVDAVVSTLFSGKTGVPLANAAVAVDLAIAPDGSRVVVVSAGNHLEAARPSLHWVWMTHLMDPADGACGGRLPRPPTSPDAGVPDAGAPDPYPETFAQPSGEPIAVAFTRAGHLVVQTREPAALELVTMRPVRRILLSTESRADTGHAIFHANTPAGMACASCHPEGGDDGNVWRIAGSGPRRTQSLRGGVLATAPFHWGGELATVSDLLREVFEVRLRGPHLDHQQRDALGRWLDRIPALPRGPTADEDAAARGRQLFQNAALGCVSCHAGDTFTNNQTVDVGTGGALQVPSLRGLWLRGPLMHDGCARTVADRFLDPTCGGGDRHGLTSHLSTAQLRDLMAYLEML